MILEPKGRGWRVVSDQIPREWIMAPEDPQLADRADKRWEILRKKVQAGSRIGRI